MSRVNHISRSGLPATSQPAGSSATEDTAPTSATDLRDITDTDNTLQSLDGEDETTDWFQFTLTDSKRVQLGLWQLDADVTIILEDEDGDEIQSKTGTDVGSLRFTETLQAGTYYVRVDADEVAQNDYKLSWRTGGTG